MKTALWVLKILSSIVLIFMITEDTFMGSDILWTDVQYVIYFDSILLFILLIWYKTQSKEIKESKSIVLYILLHGNLIKGFGYSFCDLLYQLNEARKQSITTKQPIKIIKITISDSIIHSADVFVE